MGVEMVEMARCPQCGQTYKGWLEPARACRCHSVREAALAQLEVVDPGGRMRLDTLTDVHYTLAKCRDKGGKLAAGNRRRGMLLVGEPGRGKTHLMVGMLRAALEAGRLACWFNVVDLVQQVRASYARDGYNGPTRAQLVAHICRHELVMLDDLGQEHPSLDVHTLLYELVDGLYQRRRSLVLSTNLTLPEYQDRYDPAVRSRVGEMCNTLPVEGRDRRRQGGGGFYEQ